MPKKKTPRINRHKRRVLHEVWKQTVIRPLIDGKTNMGWLARSHRDGLTPGEIKYIEETVAMMHEVHKRVLRIYERLKL